MSEESSTARLTINSQRPLQVGRSPDEDFLEIVVRPFDVAAGRLVGSNQALTLHGRCAREFAASPQRNAEFEIGPGMTVLGTPRPLGVEMDLESIVGFIQKDLESGAVSPENRDAAAESIKAAELAMSQGAASFFYPGYTGSTSPSYAAITDAINHTVRDRPLADIEQELLKRRADNFHELVLTGFGLRPASNALNHTRHQECVQEIGETGALIRTVDDLRATGVESIRTNAWGTTDALRLAGCGRELVRARDDRELGEQLSTVINLRDDTQLTISVLGGNTGHEFDQAYSRVHRDLAGESTQARVLDQLRADGWHFEEREVRPRERGGEYELST